jgi:hypothetical protein
MIENSYKDAKQLGPGEYRFRMRSRLCALDWELERQILNIKGIEIWNVISNLSRQTPRGLRIT